MSAPGENFPKKNGLSLPYEAVGFVNRSTYLVPMAMTRVVPICPTCGLYLGMPASHASKPTDEILRVDCPCGWDGVARFYEKQRSSGVTPFST